MTNEEKELLLKDLCARLPYGVIVHLVYDENHIVDREMGLNSLHDIMFDNAEGKPYLRPLSSMTDEEMEELQKEHPKDEKLFTDCIEKSRNGDDSMRGKVISHFAADWCDKKMFDYRGLIPMGLALPAKEGMYKND